MSLGSQARLLSERAARMRQDISGTATVVYDNGKFDPVPGYHSPISKKQKTEQFGFLVPLDAVVRISKTCGFMPEVGKSLRVIWPTGESFKLRIAELPISYGATEWALGCKADL